MIRKRDKHREGGRGAEKCVSEHWVTPLLNLSASKVSPKGRGSEGWMGTRGGESLRRKSEKERKVKGCTQEFSQRRESSDRLCWKIFDGNEKSFPMSLMEKDLK